MSNLREELRSGLEYLHTVTELHQRVRAAHPTFGLYEASELQWYWTIPRPTDDVDQLFWFDDDGRPAAAMVAVDFGDGVSLVYDAPMLIVSVMPDLSPDTIAHMFDRGLAHIAELGIDAVELEVDRADAVQRQVLFDRGFTVKEDALIECWLDIGDRPEITPLHDGYRLSSRAELADRPHHMAGPRRPKFHERLEQISLYRPDLDLVVLDANDEPAAQAIFWFDPSTATGSIEPVRTYDGHQQRGLSRHLLATGIERLAELGASRVAIGYEPDNPASGPFYLSLGFEPHRRTDVMAGPTRQLDESPNA
ncbi:GNAT family N-acetyltransferase [Ilumatobacter sp.]|uniref:GNAT family N-acetyltransferase n=1 Tax=Ilumatobacter sp. TaxID=1967498 RepID=UPI003AF7F4A5